MNNIELNARISELEKKVFEQDLQLRTYEGNLGLCNIIKFKTIVSNKVFVQKSVWDSLKTDNAKADFMTKTFVECSRSFVEPFAFMMNIKNSINYRWTVHRHIEDVASAKCIWFDLTCYLANTTVLPKFFKAESKLLNDDKLTVKEQLQLIQKKCPDIYTGIVNSKEDYCPSNFGLKDTCLSKFGELDCKKCWDTALKED